MGYEKKISKLKLLKIGPITNHRFRKRRGECQWGVTPDQTCDCGADVQRVVHEAGLQRSSPFEILLDLLLDGGGFNPGLGSTVFFYITQKAYLYPIITLEHPPGHPGRSSIPTLAVWRTQLARRNIDWLIVPGKYTIATLYKLFNTHFEYCLSIWRVYLYTLQKLSECLEANIFNSQFCRGEYLILFVFCLQIKNNLN